MHFIYLLRKVSSVKKHTVTNMGAADFIALLIKYLSWQLFLWLYPQLPPAHCVLEVNASFFLRWVYKELKNIGVLCSSLLFTHSSLYKKGLKLVFSYI